MQAAARAAVPDDQAQSVDLAGLYARRANWMRRLVGHQLGAPAPLVEDACQVAWTRLAGRRDRVAPDAALVWLVRTAEHETLRLVRRADRERSLDALVESEGDRALVAGGPSPIELAEHRARLAELQTLPQRQRRLLWLQALGLSYAEIAATTGASQRTVERQLKHGRRRLALLEAADGANP
ncbi:MAG: RNA polymerase sigma factor [Solirubrobacteraceae bacterium]